MLRNITVFSKALRKDSVLRQSLLRNLFRICRLKISLFFSQKFNGIVIINLTEHIGDIVACEPVSGYIRNLYPKAYILWSVNRKYAELVRYNPNINEVLAISCLTEWILIKRMAGRFARIFDMHIDAKRCSVHRISSRNSLNKQLNHDNCLSYGNLLKVATLASGIQDISDRAPRFYFRPGMEEKRMLSGNYIVIHTLANDEERNWTNEKWNQLFRMIVTKFPEYKVVELGLTNVIKTDDPHYLDLTGKLDFQEIASVIKFARLFVGVESGFAHIANALSKKGIVLIGFFQKYRNYMVYSGSFTNPSVATLIYHQGPLKELEPEKVMTELNRVLKPTTVYVSRKAFSTPFWLSIRGIHLRDAGLSVFINSSVALMV
jgi:heptosyltransferase-3